MRIGCMECGAAWSCTTPVMTCPECGAGETFVDVRQEVQANDQGEALSVSFAAEAITASAESRTLGGTLVRYGVPGRTSRGLLRVRPGALRFHADIRRTILTREHDRDTSRGILAAVHDSPERMRVQLRAADGPEGDAALQEAADGSRAGLSFDVVDATIVGDEITDALVIAIGQVGIPAYDDGRIDTIAASLNPGETMKLTPEQRARLKELVAKNNRSTEEETEFQSLQASAIAEATADPEQPAAEAPAPAAGEQVAASNAGGGQQVTAAATPAVPGGVPTATTTQPRGGALQAFCEATAERFNQATSSEGRAVAITAALQDITYSAHDDIVHQPAWSGELWSGLQYEPLWSDLFNTGTLTGMQGVGWRFTSKLAMQDYAGDKTDIPTDNVTTEQQSYDAARAAVGVDIDRAYFDFGQADAAFVRGLVEQIRESWTMLLDTKVRAYVIGDAAVPAKVSEAAGILSPALDPQTTLLKAAAAAVRSLKRRRVGRASWIYVNDEDLFSLLDVAEKDVSAFLKLFNIEPENFRSDESVPQGTVYAGVKPSATVRTLPGFPVILDAQNLAKGGVDKAAFGYWAIEQHHVQGVTTVEFDPEFVPA